jgi:hypothetical protein
MVAERFRKVSQARGAEVHALYLAVVQEIQESKHLV